jgi:hypothetical protein
MIDVVTKIDLHDKKIEKAVESKKRRVLFKQGGYLKTTMSRSLRVSKKSSLPGQPPKVRSSNSPLRKGIAFAVDGETVTCGPMIWSASKVMSNSPLPALLDKGGTCQQILPNGKTVMEQVLPRPFTKPVFSDGGKKFRELIETEKL